MEKYNNVQRLGASHNDKYCWIVYQTTNLVNNKIYIGVHKTKDPNIFDGYLGCGIYNTQPASYIYGKTKFELAVKKYGPSNFKRIVLKVFDNEDDAYLEESRLVNEDFLKRNDVYNMILGGKIPYIRKPEDGIEVHQYDLNGNYIKTYKSYVLASRDIKIGNDTISDAVSNNLSAGGYYWSTIKIDKLDLSKYHPIRKQYKVYKYSKSGEYIESYDSIRQTGYSSVNQAAILGYLVDKQFYFCYIKAENYSKARDIYTKQRKIYQYDSNGKFLKEWNYIEALKCYPHDSIDNCIKNKVVSKSGYMWGLQQYKFYNQPTNKPIKAIGKYTLDGELIKTYSNSSECYKENGKSVYKTIVGLRKTYKGYVYKYLS